MIPNYTYPNNFQQPMNPYLNKPMEQSNGIIWVQGIEGAKAYQMPPNSNIQLMDSENDGVFYIKVTDNIGMATLRVFRYSEVTSREMKKDTPDLSEYVKKSELNDLINGLLQEREVSNEQSVSTTKNNKPRPLIQG